MSAAYQAGREDAARDIEAERDRIERIGECDPNLLSDFTRSAAIARNGRPEQWRFVQVGS